MIEQTQDRNLRQVPRILGERCGATIVEVHPNQLKKQIAQDGSELMNHAGRGLTLAVRLVLLGVVWLQLKSAEKIGLLEQRWTARRSA